MSLGDSFMSLGDSFMSLGDSDSFMSLGDSDSFMSLGDSFMSYAENSFLMSLTSSAEEAVSKQKNQKSIELILKIATMF